MVPSGWEECKLSDLCEKVAVGLAISVTPYMRETGTKLIRNQNIKRNFFNTNSVVYIDNEFADKNKSKKVYAGDVVAVRTGSNIGEACVVPKEFDGALTFTTLIARPKYSKLSSEFLGLHINSERGVSEVNRLMAGGGKPNLNSGELKNYKLLTPPIAEQRKIAKILSTWDKAISTTERLIYNSKQQKKALMQKLLTGKKRLLENAESESSTREGFAKRKLGKIPNDWSVSLLSKYYWYQEGPGVRKHQFTESGVKLFNGTNIQNSRIDLSKTKTFISESEANNAYSHFLADSGDLVIACSGISVDKFDEKISFLESKHLPLCMNTSTMRFKVKKGADACLTYLRYFMMSPIFKNQIRRQITGSAQLNFGPSHVGECFIGIPSLEEQKRISAVLTIADQEIDLLEQQLADLKLEKKALMQQLLTGKRRVKIDKTEAA